MRVLALIKAEVFLIASRLRAGAREELREVPISAVRLAAPRATVRVAAGGEEKRDCEEHEGGKNGFQLDGLARAEWSGEMGKIEKMRQCGDS